MSVNFLRPRHITSIFADFDFSVRDEPSELPYLQPEPSQTAAEARHHADRALLRDVVNVIPQVVEERQGEDLAEFIALAHRRYVLAAGAEFKKLVYPDEPSTKPASAPAPRRIAPHTAALPPPPLFSRRAAPVPERQSAAPHVRTGQNTNASMTDIKSRRRVGMLYSGAVARELNAVMRYRVASKVWI